MAVKSIVDIEVNDEQFKAFSKMFEKYQSLLAKTPNAWKKVGGATGEAAGQFERIAAALMAQNHLTQEVHKQTEKGGKVLDHHAKLWANIHRHTSGILKDVTGIAKFVVGGGIGLGAALLGMGGLGLFGFDRLADSVSKQRNFALGSFMQMGQGKAFSLYAGRNISNPHGFLSDIAGGLHNVGSPAWNALRTLGVDTHGGTLQVAERALLRIQARAKSMPTAAVGNMMQMYGLSGLGLSQADLFTLRNLSRKELTSDVARSNLAAPGLMNADRTGRSYQNFLSTLGTTWGGIRANLVRDLVALTGPLETLSKALGSAANSVLTSPALKTGIQDLASGLEEFAHWITSPSFQKGFRDFVADMGKIAHWMGMGSTANSKRPVTSSSRTYGRFPGESAGNFSSYSTDARYFAEAAKKYGVPSVLTAAINAYTPGGITSFLGGGKTFAATKRLSQGMKLLGLTSASVMSSREHIQQALAAYYVLTHGGGPFEVENLKRKIRSNPHGWLSALGTTGANRVRQESKGIAITVHNATGANIHTTLNQMGGSGG